MALSVGRPPGLVCGSTADVLGWVGQEGAVGSNVSAVRNTMTSRINTFSRTRGGHVSAGGHDAGMYGSELWWTSPRVKRISAAVTTVWDRILPPRLQSYNIYLSLDTYRQQHIAHHVSAQH